MIEPKLEHYPKWLRGYINSGSTNQKDFIEIEKALEKLVERARLNPETRILFNVLPEGIRLKFKVYALQHKLIEIDGLLKELQEKHSGKS
jgi:hypothetical protein